MVGVLGGVVAIAPALYDLYKRIELVVFMNTVHEEHKLFELSPPAPEVRVVSRIIPPQWGSIQLRPPICTYAPWGALSTCR